MDISKYRTEAILTFIIGTLIIAVLFVKLPDIQRTIANGFTLFGTYFSLYGLLIAYLQIKSIKETSKETQKAVNESTIRINQVLSISELSKSNKIIQEIQTSLQNDKLELALIRMKDLKSILIQIKYNEDLLEYTNAQLYNQNITELGGDINNLHDQINIYL